MKIKPIIYKTSFILLLPVLLSSCTPTGLLISIPNLSATYFENKINRLSKKKDSFEKNRSLIKSSIEYVYGVIFENNDRLLKKDYKKANNNYKKAYSILIDVEERCLNNLVKSNQDFYIWYNGNENIELEKENVFELYYLSAAIGGLIISSKGDPNELINFKKIEKLLKMAIKIHPSWGDGSLQSAMMGYTASRMDLSAKSKRDTINYYFNKSKDYSENQDISLFVKYAEIVHVPDQNKVKYIETLNYVIKFKSDRKSTFALTNIIAKKRAKWLKKNLEDRFL